MSREIRFHTLDVFTDRFLGGNPLAVVPDGASVPEEYLQPLAREFNLSETVFVYPPDDAKHTRRLRIFTPSIEFVHRIGTTFTRMPVHNLRRSPWRSNTSRNPSTT